MTMPMLDALNVGEKAHGHGAGHQARENTVGAWADHQPPKDEQAEPDSRPGQPSRPFSSTKAAKAKSVVRSGMNSRWVCVPASALLVMPPRADGDLALDDVKAVALAVFGGVEQGADAVLLVFP